MQLLNERGQLGYILPHKFFNARYGEALRGLLGKGKHLSQIVHLGDQQVFEGATTYTCLLFLNKSATTEFSFVKVEDLRLWQETGQGNAGIISSASIGSNEWNFSVGKTVALLEKLNEIHIRLGTIAERMSQGIRTSANEVYVLDLIEENQNIITAYSKQLSRNVSIEREAISLFLQGREIKSFQIMPSGKVVIMPYRNKANRAELIEEKAMKQYFPKTFDYLSENKAFLKNRESGRFAGFNWYAYGRNQNIDLMLLPKILIPDIADRASFALDESGQYAFTSGYGITLKKNILESPKYVIGLLNSKLLDFYLKSVSTTLRGGYFRYFTQFIQQIPIRTINFSDKTDRARHDQMVQLVDQMIEAKMLLAKALTDGDQTFYLNKCAALSRQIDKIVYDLYRLTDEEINLLS